MSVFRKLALVGLSGILSTVGLVAMPSTSSAVPPDGTLLTVGWDSTDMYSVDPSDAATTLVGETSVVGITGLAWDETTGTMYAVEYDAEPASLYTIDPDTGARTVVAATGIDDPTGLDAQPGTGELFMVYDHPDDSGSILATVDRSTAAVDDIGPTLDGDLNIRLSAIAFDPTDGALYGVTYDDDLYEIDPATGEATLVFAAVGEAYGLAFDCDGTLYATDSGTDGNLFTIDLGTGDPTLVGGMDLDGDFSENLTILCGTVQPEPPTTTASTTASTTTTTAAARAAAVTPRFTG